MSHTIGAGGAGSRNRCAALSSVVALCALALFNSCSPKTPPHLSIVWNGDILSADPNERFETATDTYSMNVFEPLLRYDRQMSFVPVLATRWDIADGKTWRFHLRSGVVFHDGSPFTADDVVFTLERVRHQKGSDLAPYLSVISSVRKVDQETVEIISERPAGLLSVLSFVYMLPKASVESRGAAFFQKPFGTGPYRYEEWTKGVELKLQAFEGYWGGPATVQRVSFVHEDSPEKEWEVAKARAPSILLTPSRLSWNAHRNEPGFRTATRPGMSVQYLALNLRGGKENPLTDQRVRAALRAAVDVKALIEKSAQGQAFPASQYVTPDIIGYDPSLTVPEFEPGLARRLLSEAGHPEGLELKLVLTDGPSTLADNLIAMLTEAGVRVKKSPVDGSIFYDHLGRCDGDLFLTGWICTTGDASELFEGNFYGRGAHATSFTGCGYKSSELDDLIDRTARTLDPEIRRNLLQLAMRKTLADLPWIPLWVPYDRYAMSENVVWEPRPDGEIYLADVRLR